MTSKEFDKWLRENLASVHPELNAQDWDEFVHRVEDSESEVDEVFDDSVRDHLSDLTPAVSPDWNTMEKMIEEDELLFDRDVKHHVERFRVPYNPTTWPILDARIAEDEKLRRKLIYAKVLEIAAIFFVLLTFYNFFPVLIPPAKNMIRNQQTENQHLHSENTQQSQPANTQSANTDQAISEENAGIQTPVVVSNRTIPEQISKVRNAGFVRQSSGISQDAVFPGAQQTLAGSGTLSPLQHEIPAIDLPVVGRVPVAESVQLLPSLALADFTSGIVHVGMGNLLPQVNAHTSRVRFGMSASADLNTLFFPEEHFYTQGRSINFSEKEIVASGYSAGASLLFDFKNFLFETGLNYSFKSFGPNRNLFIGTSADKHTLDFENIALNVVSVPMYVHWKLGHKGAWKVYATGGTSLHVIANANYDLIAENIYTSSAVQSGQQMQNQHEVQRVREHMLDGAKFSSKGYLTLAGGLGLERAVSQRISLFAQPLYQYQIPFFGLIDQNGKHLQSGSLHFGTRVSLGNH